MLFESTLSLVCISRVFKSLNPYSNGICSLRYGNYSDEDILDVLILILMEYALWALTALSKYGTSGQVLILILMEYALWVWLWCWDYAWCYVVLILILMEYALWDYTEWTQIDKVIDDVLILILMEYALWVGFKRQNVFVWLWVLILILMEYALWGLSIFLLNYLAILVLILILMEYALWVSVLRVIQLVLLSLNPYSNGICSLSRGVNPNDRTTVWVLILILMEYALWAKMIIMIGITFKVLILILMEYALWVGLSACQLQHGHCLNPYSNGICSLSLKYTKHLLSAY